MKPSTRSVALLAAAMAAGILAQQAPSPGPSKDAVDSRFPPPVEWTAAQDHQNMMEQLGIKALRPGPSGNENAPDHANYDEGKANPFPNLPDVLTLKNGRKVKTASEWWKQRRPEIVEDFEREVLGRVPKNVPKVTWTVTKTLEATVAGHPVLGKLLNGHVDNSAYPLINVDLQMTLVTPTDVKGPVPVMMMFGGRGLPGLTPAPQFPGFPGGAARGGNAPAGRGAPAAGTPGGNAPQAGRGAAAGAPGGAAAQAGRGFGPPAGGDPPSTDQLIADGWGYVAINTGSIQADNGQGLTRGIIGLVNKGQARKPDDWGSLRAWGWGASRGLDYLETDKAVDAKKVGIEGVSRFGKAALVTMAFDTRFAVVLIGSSGEGGAKLHRRNWGEAVENLTGSGEYHWMAGNFLKYGASDASFGSKTPGDLPVDAHELIALCAPRLTFVSYGVPEKGDAKWLDHQGSFMAAVAAEPVFRLLGAKDLGVTEDFHTAKMPPVNEALLGGQLAWRQHDGGHTDGPNWKYFLPWADFFFNRRYTPALTPVPTAPPASAPAQVANATPPAAAPPAAGQNRPGADQSLPRTDQNSITAHAQLLEKARRGHIDIYFEGDSITRRWGATDYPDFLAHWKKSFFGWNAADFGWGADRIQNILWRLENGELDGVNPKVIVLLGGTNNVSAIPPSGEDALVADVTRGLQKVVQVMQSKAPNATIIVMGIFPRNDNMAVLPAIAKINQNLAAMADGRKVRFLNINNKLADSDGHLLGGMMNSDKLHPSLPGYQVWADALKPVFTELLGQPASDDLAPPPTGDPSARR